MKINEMIVDITKNYGESSLDPLVAERAILRALVFLNVDLRQEYEAVGNPKQIEPEMTSFHRELLLLRAQAYLVRIKRKAVSSNWMKTERDLLFKYWRRIKEDQTYDSPAT